MTPEEAEDRLRRGDLVGAIIIPENFSATIAAGGTAVLGVEVDNVNMDIVTDVQRSLPSAIVTFDRKTGLPGLRVHLDEHDVWPADTSFLPYITVSGLALAGQRWLVSRRASSRSGALGERAHEKRYFDIGARTRADRLQIEDR